LRLRRCYWSHFVVVVVEVAVETDIAAAAAVVETAVVAVPVATVVVEGHRPSRLRPREEPNHCQKHHPVQHEEIRSRVESPVRLGP